MTAFDFYTQEKATQNKRLKEANKQLNLSSMLRLILFIGTAFGIYYFYPDWKIAALIGVVGFGIFLFLVSRHSDLKYKRNKIDELVKLNETELEVLNRNFSHLATGKEFEDHDHPFSQDIDLFGNGSFFQYLNRTSLKDGKRKLAKILTENTILQIPEKQEAIKELAEKATWRQEFSAVAKLVKTENSSSNVLKWLTNYKTFVPKFMFWLSWVFTAISILLIAAYYMQSINGWFVFGWFLVGWGITAIYVKKINVLAGNVGKVQDTFHQYYQLLGMIETVSFQSDILKEQQSNVTSEEKKASKILKSFSKAIDALDQRNNGIFIAIGNGFLLWDLRQSLRLEKWISAHYENVKNWFEVIEFIDAYNSLGNFAFNHAHYSFPEIHKDKSIIKAQKLGHPLLNPEKRVDNDIYIENEHFMIITGANMAGKSTFLRTVSLHIVMANIGLPVCADKSEYTPIKLITSMRTTDSLSDDESYFFSELKRLQYIVNEIQEDKYFIILDEILKGTNSTDKAIGSKKFIQKLVKSKSTGIIATHDLSLCEVSDELKQVENHYFDAEIVNDELFFDYKFKEGICQNMNASFLLKKMNIVD
ncbi:MutS-related protein [Gillisia hiemivivida]|uniref:DNA mismatch repair protein MutS n=1 Tax=Gillisia hiemivivida TaxID=291190 RepID=A0A5C6ZU21_9FLAO|nr:DNA mismatch repair protein MutS [Gillisia hiemivivida]TXD93656.1 DNA mismatch repair protein MutS [Gillisia hiemivivida]